MKTRTLVLCLMFFACLGIAHATITVGTCKSVKNPYLTISSAITASPANGLIQVCPGTYAEQLVITKPLSIVGLTIAKQPGVTITSPITGIVALDTMGDFALVYAKNAGGPVRLSNLSIQGGLLATFAGPMGSTPACIDGIIGDFAGIRFDNTPAQFDHLNVSGQEGVAQTPGSTNLSIPYCGNGMELGTGTVEESAVTRVGHYGIYGGDLTLDHNVVAADGPLSVGIHSTGVVTNNIVTGSSVGGGPWDQSVGISGGDRVQSNTVQSWDYGIVGASHVLRNIVLNDNTGIVGNDVSLNLIYARPTYIRTSGEACVDGSTDPTCILPTVGTNLNCVDGSLVRENGILNVGIGMASVESDASFSPTNVISGVTTTSTGCPQ